MAATFTLASEPYLLINSSAALTVGSTISVTYKGVAYTCTVIKAYVGTRNYVVKMP